MSSPNSWTPDWQAALVKARLGIIGYREGLTAQEFAALAGVNIRQVNLHAAAGLEEFQQRFGKQCSFHQVSDSKFQVAQRVYTFGGAIRPPATKPPLPGLMSLPQFCQHQEVKDWRVRLAARKGHSVFRQQFPGWDFIELEYAIGSSIARWFGPVEDIGEQPDSPLDETALTIYRFADVVGACAQTVRTFTQKGSGCFEQRFPGWSFRQQGKKVVYCRQVEEPPYVP
ncbi:hypothetical protein [Leptolyngbya iicbica]|nr:hypothetical protein [Leptolyngbya sp. LK]